MRWLGGEWGGRSRGCMRGDRLEGLDRGVGKGVLRECARSIAGIGVVGWKVDLEVGCVVLASFSVDAGHV